MFGVPSRTIIKALARVERPVSMPRNNPILEPFRPHIDALLSAQPPITIWAIWTALVDDHDADVSYGTVRDYVARHRRQAQRTPETLRRTSKPASRLRSDETTI
jgi:hypothetical protein